MILMTGYTENFRNGEILSPGRERSPSQRSVAGKCHCKSSGYCKAQHISTSSCPLDVFEIWPPFIRSAAHLVGSLEGVKRNGYWK